MQVLLNKKNSVGPEAGVTHPKHVVYQFDLQVSKRIAYALSEDYVLSKVDLTQYSVPYSIASNHTQRAYFDAEMKRIEQTYEWLLQNKIPKADAEILLPDNIICHVSARLSLAKLATLAVRAAELPVHEELRKVIETMVSAVIAHHPWAETHLKGGVRGHLARLRSEILFAVPDKAAREGIEAIIRRIEGVNDNG